MSVNITTGAKSLVQLGVSVADVALLYDFGRRFGNFLRAGRNEAELFESLMEDPEAILKRRGLVEPHRMESRWSEIHFMYESQHISNAKRPQVASKQDLTALSWLMVVVIAGLDVCLDNRSVQLVIIQAFRTSLDGNQDVEDSLNVQMPTLTESWRDVGAVRKISSYIAYQVKVARTALVQTTAIPQLNREETSEFKELLVWLLGSENSASNDFNCLSATVFALARAMQKAGILLCAGGTRQYETQPLVRYVPDAIPSPSSHLPSEYIDPLRLNEGMLSRAQMVSYPLGKPESMIDTLGVSRAVMDQISRCWHFGTKAAQSLKISATAQTPFTPSSEVEYFIENTESVTGRYQPQVSFQVTRAFPTTTETLMRAMEDEVLYDTDFHQQEWLGTHTELGFLTRTESVVPDARPEDMHVFLKYQALVFGFYYRLFEPLLSLEYINKEAFVRGVWGYGSTTALAACTQFGDSLRREGCATRSHLLYLLSMLYGGRAKLYSRKSNVIGLVGVRGPITVISLPLLRPTDRPEDICRIAIVELPIIDLAANAEGELRASTTCSIGFEHPPAAPVDIQPHGPAVKWSVHAKMGTLFRQAEPSVVMVARCGDGRLVGRFSPLAADVVFLSTAYRARQQPDSSSLEATTPEVVRGFEIQDSDWAKGIAFVPRPDAENTVGVVHSRGCPALRYAATGFYASTGVDVAISEDDIGFAVGRFELQGGGIFIA